MLNPLQGELFSKAYFDGLAAEVDDNLQEAGVVSGAGRRPHAVQPAMPEKTRQGAGARPGRCAYPMRMHEVATAGQPTIICRKPQPPSHLAVGDLARRFGLGAEMIGSVLSERVASGAIRGRMEAGVVHTPAYLARIKAQLRWGNNGLAAGAPSVEGACSGVQPLRDLHRATQAGPGLLPSLPLPAPCPAPLWACPPASCLPPLLAGARCVARCPPCRSPRWSRSLALRGWPH